ncbi:Clp protease ClpP [Mesorhizobium sp. M4A.F.Ca.ET.020.02.1.1]|uniref:head maturation protease, ClpP-related n=1 Tax=Mesorhizobium sp. M4A.F.Ca.ET.020.02.1.1 TaxID=2496652 RepID=UPI000FD50EB6|nr:head maturation protease, ClpP-related [Mesorhizobium sp. M4A.F.Ca.ET.020.02.1.1]RVD44199.1 Clp protease ClpP [Mesorhizobium sp. M4A.F.Ca.ET.020.02.1.1]
MAKLIKQLQAKTASIKVVARGAQRAEIYVYGVIGGDWFGDGASASQFAKDLKAVGNVTDIDLHIDSEGGSVQDAQAMYTLLVAHSAKITTHIDGWACSAASFLAMAGEKILIGEGGMFMIHNARMMAYGEAEDLERGAALLRTTNQTILQKYVDRTGLAADKVKGWMDAETWWTGKEAVDAGFCNEVVANLKVAAVAARDGKRDVSPFKNVPRAHRPRRNEAAAKLAALAK